MKALRLSVLPTFSIVRKMRNDHLMKGLNSNGTIDLDE